MARSGTHVPIAMQRASEGESLLHAIPLRCSPRQREAQVRGRARMRDKCACALEDGDTGVSGEGGV